MRDRFCYFILLQNYIIVFSSVGVKNHSLLWVVINLFQPLVCNLIKMFQFGKLYAILEQYVFRLNFLKNTYVTSEVAIV